MNPQQDNDNQSNNNPLPESGYNPSTPIPQSNYDTSEADAAAMQAVEALESQSPVETPTPAGQFGSTQIPVASPTPETTVQNQYASTQPTVGSTFGAPSDTTSSMTQNTPTVPVPPTSSTAPVDQTPFNNSAPQSFPNAAINQPSHASAIPAKKKSKTPLIIALSVVVLLLAAVGGYLVWQDIQNQPAQSTELVPPSEPQSGDITPGTDLEGDTPAPALPDPDLAQ